MMPNQYLWEYLYYVAGIFIKWIKISINFCHYLEGWGVGFTSEADVIN